MSRICIVGIPFLTIRVNSSILVAILDAIDEVAQPRYTLECRRRVSGKNGEVPQRVWSVKLLVVYG